MTAAAEVKTGEPGVAIEMAAPRERQLPELRADADGNISPSQLIMAALDRGIAPEGLEKLVALQERMEDRNARKEFARDLAAFKADLPAIVHSKKASFKTSSGHDVKYSYTELDELANIIDPVLEKYGFTYHWDQKFDGKFVTTTCRLEHIGGHSRTASFTLPSENSSAASPQQKIGMADTYAGRRSLIAVLGLTTADKDPRPKEIDPTPIADDQVTEILDLIDLMNDGKTKDQARRRTEKFLKYMDVDSVDKIRAVDYQKAVAALQQRDAPAKKGSAGEAHES